ncbi:hypothetical protein EI94DRAFT_1746587 [Lactarius quietus]|nr:hypothetical protein EI94DRAFT_1746587 [Lactarius quietus]
MRCTGLTFIGMGKGMLLGLDTQPLCEYKDTYGQEEPPPEFRLRKGQVEAVLAPIVFFWLAFTTYRGVHWILPILATVPFGTATYFIFASSMTYIVTRTDRCMRDCVQSVRRHC